MLDRFLGLTRVIGKPKKPGSVVIEDISLLFLGQEFGIEDRLDARPERIQANV